MNFENNQQKKKRGCLWWIGLLVVVVFGWNFLSNFVDGFISGYNSAKYQDENPPETQEQNESVGNQDTENTKDTENTDVEPSPSNISFTITAGQQGECGKLITYNAGTEFAEEFFAYYVPAGTYEVTNNTKYMTQVNVYSDEKTVNEDGWEEPAEVYVVQLIDAGKTAEITVGENQHIEVTEPTVLELSLKQ